VDHNVVCRFNDAEDLPVPVGPSSHFFPHGSCAIKPTLPEVDAVQPSGRVNWRIGGTPEGRINFLGFFSAQPWNKESWHFMTSRETCGASTPYTAQHIKRRAGSARQHSPGPNPEHGV